ncbi:TLDc domain-containing protein [Entamoeba marina]
MQQDITERLNDIEMRQYVFEKYMDNREVVDKQLLNSIEELQSNESQKSNNEVQELKKSDFDILVKRVENNEELIKEVVVLKSIVNDLLNEVHALKSSSHGITKPILVEKNEVHIDTPIPPNESPLEQKTIVDNEVENENEVVRERKISSLSPTPSSSSDDDGIDLEDNVKTIIQDFSERKITDIIYKGTEEGFSAEEFNRCCCMKKHVAVIVKTTNNDIFGGVCSEIPLIEDTAKGVFADKEHFVFSIKDNKGIKFVKRSSNSYSAWIFPDDSENLFSFGGAFLITGNCGANEKKDYIDNGETILSQNNFKVEELFVLQLE